MTMSAAEIRDGLRESFENALQWRREKAAEHSADQRNDEAASIFDKLIGTLGEVNDDVLIAYAELGGDFEDFEEHSEILRSVGFDFWPKNASEFVRHFIAKRTAN